MLKTNFENFTSDLNEVLNEFISINCDIQVNGKIVGETFYAEVIIDDKTYNYDYSYTATFPIEKKRLQKRFLKLSLYKALSNFTGVSLPWGALTGIRPTKLAYQQGDNFENFFLNTMLVSQSKTDLIAKILQTQQGIYRKKSGDGDLFVSVPFCPTRCAYCSFISNEISKEKLINGYIDGLLREIEASKKLIKNLRSVYIGGGTPVALSDELFYKLMQGVGKMNVEYTVEAGRPDAITEEKLKIMKEFGVTRVCVNPQTFKDETLLLIGRRHTAKDIMDKFALVRSYGFDVNMDLIAGLPDESLNDFKNSLNVALSLNPENITVHTLCLKSGSKLKESISKLSEGEVSKMVEYSHQRLQDEGFLPYYLYRQKYMAGNLENTGYSKPDKVCVYNVDIMEETADIVANGANAVSKRVTDTGKITRLGAPKDTATYISKVDKLIEEKISLFSE